MFHLAAVLSIPYSYKASAAGKDGKTADETCPLLSAAVGGEPRDKTVIWQYVRADRLAFTSGGIAGNVETGKSIQSQNGAEGCLTKRDGKAVVSSCGTRLGAHGPCAPPVASRRTDSALDPLAGYIVGLSGAVTEIPD